MEIYTSFESGRMCLVLFKTREDCQTFINYLSSLKGDDALEPKSSRSYSNFLDNFAFKGD